MMLIANWIGYGSGPSAFFAGACKGGSKGAR